MKKQILFATISLLTTFAHAATYEVPVEDRLKPVATFDIKAPNLTDYDKTTQLSYQLPPELVGENFPPITMTGKISKRNTLKFSSKQGEAFCLKAPNASFTCNLQMKNLNIDANEVQKFLEKTSATPEELSLRLEVADRFSGDPVGILKY